MGEQASTDIRRAHTGSRAHTSPESSASIALKMAWIMAWRSTGMLCGDAFCGDAVEDIWRSSDGYE